MSEQTLFLIFAVAILAMIPIVPKMVTFRIKVLRFLRLAGFADWHERNFRQVVIALRCIFVGLASILLWLAIYGR